MRLRSGGKTAAITVSALLVSFLLSYIYGVITLQSPVSESSAASLKDTSSPNLSVSYSGDSIAVSDYAPNGIIATSNLILSTTNAPNGYNIRLNTLDSNTYNWFPIGTGTGTTNAVLNPIDHLKTLDYPVTTRSISDSSGNITKGLAWAFYEATNLATSVSFVNSNGVGISGSIGSHFLSSTHRINTSLVDLVDLTSLANWNVTSIGDGFLYYTHEDDNSSLTSPIDLAPLAGWNVSGSIGDYFLAFVHSGNTSLLDISSFRLPNWAKDKVDNTNYALYRTFYLDRSTTTAGGEPTFMDGTVISSAGAPSTNRQTYYNRSSINPSITGWK